MNECKKRGIRWDYPATPAMLREAIPAEPGKNSDCTNVGYSRPKRRKHGGLVAELASMRKDVAVLKKQFQANSRGRKKLGLAAKIAESLVR